MTKTIGLNDTQLVLLSHAAQNDAGAILPLPSSQQQEEERARKELKSLLRRKLITEGEVTHGTEAWRSDGDLSFGLIITDKGREAIGVGDEQDDAAIAAATMADTNNQVTPAQIASPRPGSKIGAVIALLHRGEGATLDEMVAATGWLPHTTRAALTGLRKKGHTIEKTKRGDVTCYQIAAES
ncbi:MAG: DUF3489 domain-containing protein [Novosphingobium sp.]